MPPASLPTGACRAPACGPASFHRRRVRDSIGTVEVGLISTLNKRLIIVKVFAAFDGDGAGIGGRLAFYRSLRLGARSAGCGTLAAAIATL
jgi:hypothetical protein